MQNVAKLQLINFLKGFNFSAPIYSLYFLLNGVSLGEITFTLVFYSLFSFMSEVPTGMFADKFGHKISLFIGNFINAIGVFSMIIFPNIIGLILNNAIQGIGEAFLSGSSEALYYESHQKEKGSKGYSKSFGKFLALNGYGFIIGTLIAGAIFQFFGQSAFVTLILLSVTANLVTAFLTLTLKNIDIKNVAAETGSHMFQFVGQSFKFVKNNKIVFALTAVSLLTLNGEYFLRETYQPLFVDLGVMPFFVGAVLGIGTILKSLINQYSYKLEQFLNLEQILLLINIVQGILFILFAVNTNPVIAVVLFISLMGVFNSQSPVVSDYLNQEIPSHMRATVLSTISLYKSFVDMFMRTGMSILIGIIGLTNVYILQGGYLIVGILLGSWILAQCGCVKRIKAHIVT